MFIPLWLIVIAIGCWLAFTESGNCTAIAVGAFAFIATMCGGVLLLILALLSH